MDADIGQLPLPVVPKPSPSDEVMSISQVQPESPGSSRSEGRSVGRSLGPETTLTVLSAAQGVRQAGGLLDLPRTSDEERVRAVRICRRQWLDGAAGARGPHTLGACTQIMSAVSAAADSCSPSKRHRQGQGRCSACSAGVNKCTTSSLWRPASLGD